MVRLRLLCLAALALATGCYTTHPRVTPKLRDGGKGYSVAVMAPDLDVQWQYIGTNKFFHQQALEVKGETNLADALIEELSDLGYKPRRLINVMREPVGEEETPEPAEAEDPEGEGEGGSDAAAKPSMKAAQVELRRFREDLEKLSDLIIGQDPAYSMDELGSHHVRLPDLAAHNGGEEVKVDFVLYVWGSVRLETTRETILRMAKTVVLGMMKGTVADMGNAVMGGTLGSPEEIWVRATLIEARSGRIMFHNDYFFRQWTLFTNWIWEDMGEGLIDGMPDR